MVAPATKGIRLAASVVEALGPPDNDGGNLQNNQVQAYHEARRALTRHKYGRGFSYCGDLTIGDLLALRWAIDRHLVKPKGGRKRLFVAARAKINVRLHEFKGELLDEYHPEGTG